MRRSMEILDGERGVSGRAMVRRSVAMLRRSVVMLRRSGRLLLCSTLLGACSSSVKQTAEPSYGATAAVTGDGGRPVQAAMVVEQQPGQAPPAATPPAPPPVVLPPPAPPHAPSRLLVRVVMPGARRKQKAFVHWGKKKLGEATPAEALVFERPYDSGPMDLVVRSEGYFPVHTRVFTDRDDKIAVQMTPLADRQKLYGARKEPTPEEAPPGSPSGAALPPSSAPATPTVPPAPPPAAAPH